MIKIPFVSGKFIGKVKGKKIYQAKQTIKNTLLSFFSLPIYPKFFFKPKGSTKAHLAIGSLMSLSPKEALSFHETAIRVYGGICFDEKTDPIWSDFFKSSFFIPEYEFIESQGEISINHYSFTEKLSDLEVSFSVNSTQKIVVKKQAHIPELPEWKKLVENTKKKMQISSLKKIVLCRRTEFHLNSSPCFKQIIENLLKMPHSHIFAFIQNKERGFLGSSPETLFTRVNDLLETEAIAGTRRRGTTPKEDLELSNSLENSIKDHNEFTYVKKNIIYILQKLSKKVMSKKNTLYKNPYIQHLYSSIQAITNHNSYSIIKKLHPTPAIGGYPKKIALSTLHKTESFSRRFYCSALGFKGEEEEVFAVGIRSFLIDKKTLYLYAGVGTIPSSCPQLEWEELDVKTHAILKGAGIEC